MSYTHTVQNKQKKRGGGALLAPAGDRTRDAGVQPSGSSHWARRRWLKEEGVLLLLPTATASTKTEEAEESNGAARGGGGITGAAPAT